MPTPKYVSFSNAPQDYAADQRSIESRKRLAEKLQEDAQKNIGPGQMVDNIYVGPSWTQGAAQLAKALVARGQLQDVGKEEKDLATRRSAALGQTLSQLPMPTNETQRTDQEGTGAFDMAGTAGPPTRQVNPTMQDYSAWLGRLAQIGPEATKIGGTVLGI